MKHFTLSVLLFLVSSTAFSQPNCGVTSVGLTPIPVLGTSTWKGYQGGLYPGGTNLRPAAHNSAGLALAAQVLPLDTSGAPDSVSGRVVMITVGMSNTSNESQQFVPMTDTFQNKNPYLKVINGAQGGQTAAAIQNPAANFWNVISQRLANAGMTDEQVQVVWFKEADASPSDSVFPNYANTLRSEFRNIMNVMANRYPNLKLCYLSSRIYAGYASSALNPEPYAYHSGWSVKWTIEDQVGGDTALAYTGTPRRSPWLSWGPYLWADGLTPNSDGTTWVCPDDYNNDGTHPNPTGSRKVANLLLNFFSTDETAVPWFLKQVATFSPRHDAHNRVAHVFPNPLHGSAVIHIAAAGEGNRLLRITTISGAVVREVHFTGTEVRISRDGLPAGIYFYSVFSDDGAVTVGKLVVAG